jgi:hypothetical protein
VHEDLRIFQFASRIEKVRRERIEDFQLCNMSIAPFPIHYCDVVWQLISVHLSAAFRTSSKPRIALASFSSDASV